MTHSCPRCGKLTEGTLDMVAYAKSLCMGVKAEATSPMCPECVDRMTSNIPQRTETLITCPACGGSGYLLYKAGEDITERQPDCPTCNGAGEIVSLEFRATHTD